MSAASRPASRGKAGGDAAAGARDDGAAARTSWSRTSPIRRRRYLSRKIPKRGRVFVGDYDHLARVAEWVAPRKRSTIRAGDAMSAAADFDRTRAIQREASDPAASAWVVANAGSGKTHVLTQRVIRLLLAGADPAAILCLTFTKVAAAEMARRIFGTLGAWTTLPDAELARRDRRLQGRAPRRAEMRRARRLFARALETPGGLKIQTIHAFCERLLHQFPFEANVPGQFAILDDTAAAALIADGARRGDERAAAEPRSRLGRAMRYLAEHATDEQIGAGARCGHRRARRAPPLDRAAARRKARRAASTTRWPTCAGASASRPEETEEAICREICATARLGHRRIARPRRARLQRLRRRNRTTAMRMLRVRSCIGAARSPVARGGARAALLPDRGRDGG